MATPKILQRSYADLFGVNQLPLLKEIFDSNLKRHNDIRSTLFKTVSHDREIYQVTGIEDLALPTSVSEGADYTFSAPAQGYDKTFTVVKYGNGFSISKEAIDDGKFNHVADGMRKLARGAMEAKEIAGMNIFNNGFTSETTSDGVALFSESHTTPTGTYTIANRPSTDVDLSFSSLSSAITSFSTAFRSDNGIYRSIRPKYLVVPPELVLYAEQLVQSSLKADSANNNITPGGIRGLQVISSPHLSDSDAWFLMADNEDSYLRVIDRRGIKLESSGHDFGFLNDSLSFKVSYREVVGAWRPEGAWGTTGAA